ncbi:HNH endonuclease [Beutenbergia cavernae DSM 12333]|uniref:HNH endonuclease n=1 Tax=Beutenbergia cavernae (strain ATCC BAA-8 / DSM 12333 / CCUG 43141 / JCM 11478 / NBRC 16432 / NCIMB 13614 / HKI 0122) TaxID=471853 RepID=C5C325_BEUC1|nr:HNH endonuclease [Beutenbergia cavernae]ACQ81869.1 HNH endonuclease [Beutenbergia cavernae DSM 12333]
MYESPGQGGEAVAPRVLEAGVNPLAEVREPGELREEQAREAGQLRAEQPRADLGSEPASTSVPGMGEAARRMLVSELDALLSMDGLAEFEDGVPLSDAEVLDVIAAWSAFEARAAAAKRAWAGALGRRASMIPDWRALGRPINVPSVAGDEIAVRLGISRPSAARLVGEGSLFCREFAAVGEALRDGLIDAGKAREFVDALQDQDLPVTLAVIDEVLPQAPVLALRQLAAAIQRAVVRVDPERASERHERAATRRRLHRPRLLPDGMARLSAVLTAAQAASVYAACEGAARAARAAGDARTLEQLRADALSAMGASALAQGRIGPADPGPVVPPAATEVEPAAASGVAQGELPAATPGSAGVAAVAESGSAGVAPVAESGSAGVAPVAESGSAEVAPAPAPVSAVAEVTAASASAEVEPAGASASAEGESSAAPAPAAGDPPALTAEAATSPAPPPPPAPAPSPVPAPRTGAQRGFVAAERFTFSGPAAVLTRDLPVAVLRHEPQRGPAVDIADELEELLADGRGAPVGQVEERAAPGTSHGADRPEPGEPRELAPSGDPGAASACPLADAAEIVGYGAVDPATARMLAVQPGIRVVVRDPEEEARRRTSAMPLSPTPWDAGRVQHDPPAALARYVRLRDPTCVAPGCSVSSASCDLDHVIEFPLGPTDAWNLRPLCRRHHLLKTHAGHELTVEPDGSTTWITALGQVRRRAVDGSWESRLDARAQPRRVWDTDRRLGASEAA